eukprot:SAG25_NODE_1186_length_3666_cov_9.128399_2_plen_160_part_00
MPFVGVAAGLRDAIRSILNHSFSPHLASTGIRCLVAEVPLALRNHIFVPAAFGEHGADEYQELDETQGHWTNIEILRNHCKVYGLEQDGGVQSPTSTRAFGRNEEQGCAHSNELGQLYGRWHARRRMDGTSRQRVPDSPLHGTAGKAAVGDPGSPRSQL